MKQKVKYTLGKSERLKSRKAIDLLFTEGKSFSAFPFKVIWKTNNLPAGQAGDQPPTINASLQAAFSVSKKNFKKAVDRNRIKRLMREAYRLQKNELQNNVAANKEAVTVFILFTGNELPEYDFVFLKMSAVLKKLQKNINEKPDGNT